MKLNSFICYNWFGIIANHCLDFTDEYYHSIGVTKLHNKHLIPENVRKGDIVFVKTDFIYNGHFQLDVLPRIKEPFVLITGGSSYQVSNGFSIDKIVSNSKVVKWFCTNAPDLLDADKVIHMPIGFEERERVGGNQKLIERFFNNRTFFSEKKNKILLPYHTFDTNLQRKTLFDYLSNLPFVETQKKKLSWPDYMELLNIKNTIKTLFEYHHLPGVFLDSWENLNLEKLQQQQYDFSNVDKFLKINYHNNLVNSVASEYRKKINE